MQQDDLLRRAVDVVEGLGVPYMVVGSIASGFHGEPRMTQDIDIVVDLKRRDVQDLCRAFPAPDYYVSEDAVGRAADNGGMANIICPASGDKIDLIVPRMDVWNRTQLGRRQRVRILPDREGYVASPEDVILSKMDYYREGGSEKHLRDITGILKVSGEQVDRAYVADWAGRKGLTEIWQAILRRLGLPRQ